MHRPSKATRKIVERDGFFLSLTGLVCRTRGVAMSGRHAIMSTIMPTTSSSNVTLPMRAALYIRVSSEEQAREGYSLIAQQEKLEEYVQKNGYLLDTAHCYIDEGYSGKTENRPALVRLVRSPGRVQSSAGKGWPIG